jgi:hypothetical protein
LKARREGKGEEVDEGPRRGGQGEEVKAKKVKANIKAKKGKVSRKSKKGKDDMVSGHAIDERRR